jgi:hypothetical protein
MRSRTAREKEEEKDSRQISQTETNVRKGAPNLVSQKKQNTKQQHQPQKPHQQREHQRRVKIKQGEERAELPFISRAALESFHSQSPNLHRHTSLSASVPFQTRKEKKKNPKLVNLEELDIINEKKKRLIWRKSRDVVERASVPFQTREEKKKKPQN